MTGVNGAGAARRIRVVVTDFVEADLEWESAQLRELEVEFRAFQLKGASDDELALATADADVIVVNMAKISGSLVERWRRCRLVIRHGAGYDNVDVPALTARGIPLVNVPDFCSQEVAEHAIALIFALARQLGRCPIALQSWTRARHWDLGLLGTVGRLQGKTLGIIGCGRIGSRVYTGLRSFGLRFLVCDPYLSAARVRELEIEPVPLELVCREADIITLHVPLNEETRHMIGESALAIMKPSAVVVNTARGGVVDQRALTLALRSGRLAGAALDVLEEEPPRPDDPLLSLDNVIVTPHSAWFSGEAAWEIRRRIVEQVRRFRDGLPPMNCVNEAGLRRPTATSP